MDTEPKIEIYTTRTCGYCYAAKRTLEDVDLEYTEYDVSANFEKRAWLVKATGQRTVPQIFINGESIGGYTELRAVVRAGGLP